MSDEHTIKRLVLASKSPYRRALLESAGLFCEIEDADVHEGAVVESSPQITALARAKAKALAVAGRSHAGDVIIGADQVVGFQGKIIDKSPSAEAAVALLSQLQGKTHVLHSAMVVAWVKRGAGPIFGQIPANSVDVKTPAGLHVQISPICIDVPMAMRPLSEREIRAYVDTGEWQGSVGCYKYELQGVQLFSADDGLGADQSAIIGLPLRPLLALLRQLGVNPLVNRRGPWSLDLPKGY